MCFKIVPTLPSALWPYIIQRNYHKIIGNTVEYYEPLNGTVFNEDWAYNILSGTHTENKANPLENCTKEIQTKNFDELVAHWMEENFSSRCTSLKEQQTKLNEAKWKSSKAGKRFLELSEPWLLNKNQCHETNPKSGLNCFSKPAIRLKSCTSTCDELLEKMSKIS